MIQPFGGGPILEPYYDRNRRLKSTRTVYHDDDGKFAQTTYPDFDGVGHYRTMETSGDFPAGNAREEETRYNPGLGTYSVNQTTNTPTGTFTPPLVSDPWILNTFDRQQMTEGDSATVTSCFDAGEVPANSVTALGNSKLY